MSLLIALLFVDTEGMTGVIKLLLHKLNQGAIQKYERKDVSLPVIY